MSGTFYPSRLLTAGIGLETSYGTPVAPAMLWPLTTATPTDRHVPMADDSWRSSVSASVGHTPGPLDGTLSLAGAVYADTIGYPLAGLLGSVAVAGSSAPFTTTIAALDSGTQQPPSYTITTSDPVGALRWPGAKFSSLQLTLTPDGLFTWSGSADCLAAVTAAAYSATPSAATVLAGWRAAITIGGAAEVQAVSLDLTISRALTAKRNTNGTQAPYLQRSGVLTVAGTATVAMRSDAYRAAYVAGTATSIDVNIQQGAGAATQQIQLHSSLCTLTGAARSYGSQFVEVALAWSADGNTTDGVSGGLSPIKVTLKNAVPHGTYA